jgi:hypothetical protein
LTHKEYHVSQYEAGLTDVNFSGLACGDEKTKYQHSS